MNAVKHARVLVLASRPAGDGAAVHAAHTAMQPLLSTATGVEDWPADPSGVPGPERMKRLRQETGCCATTIVVDNVRTAHLREQPIRLTGDNGTCTCDALIVAARDPRRGGAAPDPGRGRCGCATSDGCSCRGLNVLVVGGGDTALEAALHLSHVAGKVTLLHRRDRLRAAPIPAARLMALVAQGRSAPALHQVVHEVAGAGRQLAGAAVALDVGGTRGGAAVADVQHDAYRHAIDAAAAKPGRTD